MSKNKKRLKQADLAEIKQLEEQLGKQYNPKKDGPVLKVGDIYLEESVGWNGHWSAKSNCRASSKLCMSRPPESLF
jgi:hypothetical protein